MEVVCLILGGLASQSCSHAFWVLTSLHLLSFLVKMFFIILVSIVALFQLATCSKLSVRHVNYFRVFQYFGMQNFAILYRGIGKNVEIPIYHPALIIVYNISIQWL